MSVVLNNTRPVLQRYDVPWDEQQQAEADAHQCCPLRNVSQISECVWVSSKIIDEEEPDYLHTENKYISSSEHAKRRAKLFYCQFKEKLTHRRNGHGQRHLLTEKLAHALASVTHTNGIIPPPVGGL